jgi:hypothetical protein
LHCTLMFEDDLQLQEDLEGIIDHELCGFRLAYASY